MMELSTVLKYAIGAVALAVFRFIVSGTQSKFSKNIPNIFSYIVKDYSKPEKHLKMSENMWYGCWHTFSFCITAYNMFSNFEWFWPFVMGDLDMAIYSTDIEPDITVKNLYTLQITFWLSCLLYSMLETWRSDTKQLIAHHIVTLGLLLLSRSANIWRVGIVVYMVHDISDVFLYWAKALSYSKFPSSISNNLFLIFATSFFITRNIMFPFYCILPCYLVSVHPYDNRTAMLKEGGSRRPWNYCFALATFLEGLHVFWLSLIIRMAQRQVFKKAGSRDQVLKSDDSDENKNEDSGYIDERSDGEEGKVNMILHQRRIISEEETLKMRKSNKKNATSNSNY